MRFRSAVLALLLASPLAAQQDSALSVAVQLATEGRGDSARAVVRARLRGLAFTDTLYPQVLYVAGVVADDADSAVQYFRRVSIEYARSAWADRAFLRLAQLAFASGHPAGALRSAQRVLADYPLSIVRGEAGFWAGRAQIELGNPADGCLLLAQAQRDAGPDVELANRVGYHLQRCSAIRTDSAAPDSMGVAPPARPTAGPTVFSVQVAAVRTATAADETMRRLTGAGFEPHVVRDTDGLFKVRVGRFPGRQDAQQLAAEIRRKVGGSPFVVEER